MTFHCLIVGSRTFEDYDLFQRKVDHFLGGRTDVEIVSGGAAGADFLAERYANDRGFPLQVFSPDWSRYGKRAGYVRNREMHEYISKFPERGVIAFWDGKSRGTAQSFRLAREFDNPLRVVRFDFSDRANAMVE